jgi:hypothetical protein
VLDSEDKLAIFFTFNGQLLGELVLGFWELTQKLMFMYISNKLILKSTITNGLINLMQVGKFESVPRWIASSQQSQWGGRIPLRQILATTQRNHLNTTSKIVPDWD